MLPCWLRDEAEELSGNLAESLKENGNSFAVSYAMDLARGNLYATIPDLGVEFGSKVLNYAYESTIGALIDKVVFRSCFLMHKLFTN